MSDSIQMVGQTRSMFAMYSCACAPHRSFVRRGPADIVACRRCGEPIAGAIGVSRGLAAELRNATWQASSVKANLVADHINRTKTINARSVSPTTALGKAIGAALASRRTWTFTHRNTGYIVGRPGLASSNLTSRGALRRALSRLQSNHGGLRLQIVPNGRDPRSLGKLVEAEFATRVDRRVSPPLLEMRKVRGRIFHPSLEREVSVSADGAFTESRPAEVKTIEADLGDNKLLAKINGILHQVAQQALLMDASEALILFVERKFDGSGRWFAVLVEEGLEAFHTNAVAAWLQPRSRDSGSAPKGRAAP